MHINYWKIIKNKNSGKIGMAIILFVIIVSLFYPLLNFSFNNERGESFTPPSWSHPLGTNDVGEDVLTLLSSGAKTSLLVASGSTFIALFLSVLLGSIAGLAGGVVDSTLMRFVDILIILPELLLLILFASFFHPGIYFEIILMGFLIWPGGARIIRSQTLMLKEKSYIKSSITFGAGKLYITFRHIATEMGPIIAALFIQFTRRAVFMEAGLSFLGISDTSITSWGKIIHHALQYIYLDAWLWWLLPVGLMLSLTLMGLAFLGYAIEDAMNTHLRGNHA